jgi:hypothetical protein
MRRSLTLNVPVWFATFKDVMSAFRAFWDAASFGNLHFIVALLAAEPSFLTYFFTGENEHKDLPIF